MSAPTAIDVENLRKMYRDGLFGRRRIQALAGVTLAVGRGEIFGLLGPNGAGKTTLIKILLGIVRATGGSGRLWACRPGGDKDASKSAICPRTIAFPGITPATRR